MNFDIFGVAFASSIILILFEFIAFDTCVSDGNQPQGERTIAAVSLHRTILLYYDNLTLSHCFR